MSIPYGTEVERVNISAREMESSTAMAGTSAFTASCPTAWGQRSQLLRGYVEASRTWILLSISVALVFHSL